MINVNRTIVKGGNSHTKSDPKVITVLQLGSTVIQLEEKHKVLEDGKKPA